MEYRITKAAKVYACWEVGNPLKEWAGVIATVSRKPLNGNPIMDIELAYVPDWWTDEHLEAICQRIRSEHVS